MKPPRRPRAVPSRFAEAPGGAAAPGERGGWGGPWSVREKRSLLRGLREQAAGAALAEELPGLLRERLPRRREAEIAALLCRLRGRAAREAVGTRFRLLLERQRRLRALPPAPIQVWLELAQTLSEGLEEPMAAALAQVLTVAGTEPLSLLRSVPPRPRAPVDLGGPPPAPPESQTPPEGFSVDFQRVYEFLGLLCRGGGAALPPQEVREEFGGGPRECLVLLALLGALPPALGSLDRGVLGGHLRGAYGDLTAPPKPAPPEPPNPLGSAPSGPPPPRIAPFAPRPPQISPPDPKLPPQDPKLPLSDPPDPKLPPSAPPDPQFPPSDPKLPPPDPQFPPSDPKLPPQDTKLPPQDPKLLLSAPPDPKLPPQDPKLPLMAPPDPKLPPPDPKLPPPDPKLPLTAPPDPQYPPSDPKLPPQDPKLPLTTPPDPKLPPQDPKLPPQDPNLPPSAPPDPQFPPSDPNLPPPDPKLPLSAPPDPNLPPPSPWRGLGFCPLNPFLVPLRLLARGETPA